MANEVIEGFVILQSSPFTRRMYRSDLQDLERYLGSRGLEFARCDEREATAWRMSLEKRGLAPATVARKISVARTFYENLLTAEIQSGHRSSGRNPFARVRPPRFDRSQGKTPCPTVDDAGRLLGAVPRGTRRGLRDRAILLLLFNQGMRVGEVAKLRMDHLSLQEGFMVATLLGKGGSRVQTVLSAEVRSVLEDHMRGNQIDRGYVFSAIASGEARKRTGPLSTRAIHSAVKHYARLAGLDPRSIRPHSGRVFFVTQAYAETHDLERVARAVGHRNIATTRKYLRYQERLSMHAALSVHIPQAGNAGAA